MLQDLSIKVVFSEMMSLTKATETNKKMKLLFLSPSTSPSPIHSSPSSSLHFPIPAFSGWVGRSPLPIYVCITSSHHDPASVLWIYNDKYNHTTLGSLFHPPSPLANSYKGVCFRIISRQKQSLGSWNQECISHMQWNKSLRLAWVSLVFLSGSCQTQRTFSGLICGHDSFCTVVSGPVAETLLETFQAHAAALNQEAFFPFCTLCKPVYFALDSWFRTSSACLLFLWFVPGVGAPYPSIQWFFKLELSPLVLKAMGTEVKHKWQDPLAENQLDPER